MQVFRTGQGRVFEVWKGKILGDESKQGEKEGVDELFHGIGHGFQ